jgi:hypothetical protein
MKLKLKQDKYRKSRGGHSRFLAVSCAKCKTQVAIYQKDGPGILKRMYLDRIVEPKNAATAEKFICKKCKEVLGVPIVYKKENRPAYRLFEGAVTKKIIRAR